MEKWTEEITPKNSLFDLQLKEVWRYRDLLLMFVKRDFVAFYKQTILGPIWFVVQPLLTSLTYLVIFSGLAGIKTDNIPVIVFYLSGVTLWNYFSDCLNKTATVFRDNAGIFGKVYFPRLIMPLSIVVSNLVRFGIQFLLFVIVWSYYFFNSKYNLQPNWTLLLIPYLVVLMAVLSLGLGMIISSLTTKYKDLIFLLTFGVQLLMYATPIIYPLSELGKHSKFIQKFTWIIKANPLSAIVETFRYAFTGSGSFSWLYIGYSSLIAFFVLMLGAVIFNKVQRSFMDTV